ncbi:hypothetical protein HAALTHF_42520n [Vreelandella aquamarina]|nr:hypothetical protein HAALTHF_42520n [Halomonas axialensis]
MRDQPGNLPLHHWPSHGGQAAALLQRFGLPADHPLEDISANLNPLGPPGWVTGYLAQRLAGLGHTPSRTTAPPGRQLPNTQAWSRGRYCSPTAVRKPSFWRRRTTLASRR